MITENLLECLTAKLGARCKMANVGSYVGNIVDSAMEPVGGVLGDVATSVGNIATDLGGGIAGLAQDTGSLAQDVYNNTVNDPGAMMGIANVAGRVGGIPGLAAVAGPASIALGYMGQGERDKTLGINNPTVLGRLARSLVPSIVQRPVFDFLGVTGDHSFGGYGTAEAEEEGVAGIDTSGNTAVGGSEFSMDDPDTDTDTSTSTDTGDMQDPDDIDYGYDEDDDWAEGGAVGYNHGGFHLSDLADTTLYEKTGTLGDFAAKEKIIAKILPKLSSDEKINQSLAFDNVVREEYPSENYPNLNFNQHFRQKLKSALPGSGLNYQGEVASSDENYQALLNLGLLAQEQRGREAVATYDFKNTFKFANVPEFMKKIVIDPKLNVGVAGQLSLMDMNQPSSKVYKGGIGTQFFPGVSDTGVDLSAVLNQRGMTPTVRVDQSMGPVNTQYQKTFNPDQPDSNKLRTSFNVPVGNASVTGSYEQQGTEGVSPVRNYNIETNVPVNEANLAASFSRNPGSDTINLGLSGIDFLGGKAALSAEKTFNSTGEDPRKVGATWKKQVGEGEIEVQGSINNKGPEGSVTYRQGDFETVVGKGTRDDVYGGIRYNYPLNKFNKMLGRVSSGLDLEGIFSGLK